jgi:hypothetical protein
MLRASNYLILAAMVGTVACAEMTTSDGIDKDGDGYSVTFDCDDDDADVYPNAEEKRNCRDDNCNNKVDEGTTNEDKDGDGYCPSTGDIGDCEGDAKRYPGMAEDGGKGTLQPNGIDDNCNGIIDDGLPGSDGDGDGFPRDSGDCNDNDPLVNPGAMEVSAMQCVSGDDCPSGSCIEGYCRCSKESECSSEKQCKVDAECPTGEFCKGKICQGSLRCLAPSTGMGTATENVCRDNIDNNCDGQVDEMTGRCDALAGLSQDSAMDYAKAMELCDEGPACDVDKPCAGGLVCRENRCRRIINASLDSDARARVLAGRFSMEGPIQPQRGESFVILSTGLASYRPADTCPQEGTQYETSGIDPDPSASDSEIRDLAKLTLELIAPTNAQSFAFDFHFFSAEYPEYVGSEYNDTFWVEIKSKNLTGNIAFDSNKSPIRVNNAFFSICDPWSQLPQTSQMCKEPASKLKGTGYANECGPSQGITPGLPDGDAPTSNGGSTGWLTTRAPITPGEKFTLTFYIFDKGDSILDSSVLIDNFRWSLVPAKKPLTEPK